MSLTQISTILGLLLLASINAVTNKDDVQAEISRGETALNAIIDRTVLLDTQYALLKARSAQLILMAFDRFKEIRTLRKLLEGQFAEITRIGTALRGLNAATCTLSSTTQANRIVSNSVITYDRCVRQGLSDLSKIIHNLTVTEYAYKTVYGEHGSSGLRQCAVHSNITAVRNCVDKFVADFANFSSSVCETLHSSADHITQALKIFPTCIEMSRSNATTAINSLIKSIQVCAEGSGVSLSVRELPAHHSNLSGSVDLAVSMLNKDKERMYQMQALLASMVNAFKQLALQAKQISYSQASQTANSLFPVEDSIIKNATLAKGLTPCQYVAVKFASYNYSTAIRRGVRAWVDCTSKLSSQITKHMLSLDNLTRQFDKHVEADGFPAYMRCVTQHSANSTAANECISKHSDKLLTYFNQVSEEVDAKYQVGTEIADALDHCQITFLNNTRAELAKIIHNLMSRFPQLNIHYDSDL